MREPPSEPSPSEPWDDLFRIVAQLPFLGALGRDLAQLRALLYERRALRLMAIGARGSGRTSLANALLRLPAIPRAERDIVPRDAWIRVDAAGRRIDWMEVDAGSLDARRAATLRRALDEAPVDLVLLVVRADVAEQEGRGALEALGQLDAIIAATGAKRPPVLGVLTHADRLAVAEQGPDGMRCFADGLGSIDAAAKALERLLEDSRTSPFARPIPVSIGGNGEGAHARVWNVAELARAIHAAAPTQTKVEAARALAVPPAVRRELARTIVGHCAAAAVTIGLMPLPFSDALLLLPLQGMMVSAVAYIAGQPWNRRASLEWLASVGVMGGAALGLRWGAQQLVKLVPGAGSLVSGSIAGVGTLAIGRSAIAYFVDGPGQREPWLAPTSEGDRERQARTATG